MEIKKCVEAIKTAKRIFLLSHINPDGDSIGSLLALYYAFESEVEVQILANQDIPDSFQFLVNKKIKIINDINPDEILPDDLLIIVDVGDKKRTGFPEVVEKFGQNKRLHNIDHHPNGNIPFICTECLIDLTASSTSELIYQFLREASIKITPEIAQAILLGIYTDTGGLVFDNTSSKVLTIASDLLKLGAQIKEISKRLNPDNSLRNLRLLGLALKRVFVSHNCAISYITEEDQTLLKSDENDLLGIANHLNSLDSSKLSILLIQTSKNTIRGIARTKSKQINLSHLAIVLGGGGHPRAAGFTITGRLNNNRNKLIIEK